MHVGLELEANNNVFNLRVAQCSFSFARSVHTVHTGGARHHNTQIFQYPSAVRAQNHEGSQCLYSLACNTCI